MIIAGIASAMFQLGLPSETISFFDRSPAPGSLGRRTRGGLAAPAVKGLLVRYVTYHTVYFQGDAFTVHKAPRLEGNHRDLRRIRCAARRV